MAKASVLDAQGKETKKIDLDDAVFKIQPNTAVMHQIVTAQLAAKRSGTHFTKTRGEVRGGGAKPWRQKGTGRARQGSIRAPHWKGGGVAHGPKPRSYDQRTPKKMKSLALRSALSDRFSESRLLVVESWDFGDKPSTKAAKEKLKALGAEGKVLLVMDSDDDAAVKSFRNLPDTHILKPEQLNTYDILVSDYLILTAGTVEMIPLKTGEPKTGDKSDG